MSDASIAALAGELEGLLGELADASHQAVQALERGDLGEVMRQLVTRDRLLAASAPHFEALHGAGADAAPVLGSVRASAERVAHADGRLELALGAGIQQVGSELRHLEQDRIRAASYGVGRSSAGANLDLTR